MTIVENRAADITEQFGAAKNNEGVFKLVI